MPEPTEATFPWMTENTGRPRLPLIDPTEHFRRCGVGPIEHTDLDECPIEIRNIGWTLGNDCPYRCTHCYSMSAREKGMDFTPAIIDRVVDQLARNGVETTTSGITLTHLERDHPKALARLNDIDVSFDSPYPDEHNANRGAKLFKQAVHALEICRDHAIPPHSVIMCAMAWNFTGDRIDALVDLARTYDAHIRINPLKPVEAKHMETALPADQYYAGFSRLMRQCSPIDLGEPPLAAVTDFAGAAGCPCGRTSFRIHSITPTGQIPVSPCVYLHDYKVGDLVVDELHDIVRSPQFRTFRRRNAHPETIPGCAGCPKPASCRGGCAGRSYLHHAHTTGTRTLFTRDPYCPTSVAPTDPFPVNPALPTDQRLVHMD